MSRKRKRQTTSPSSNTLLDIVMPFYGEYRLMSMAVGAVKEAVGDIPHEIIAVDNGTKDGKARQFLRSLGLEKIHSLPVNKGYPGAVNAGVKRGSSPLVMVLTADVVMDPGSIEVMVKALDDPDIGLVGCKLVFPRDGSSPHGAAGTIQHAGIAVSIGAKFFHIHMGWPEDAKKPSTTKRMNFVTGAAIMFRRNLFNTIGGFNGDYGAGTFEDIEFCTQIRSLGSGVLYLAEAVGQHYVGGSIKEGAHRQGFDLLHNEQIYMSKFSRSLEWDEWRYW